MLQAANERAMVKFSFGSLSAQNDSKFNYCEFNWQIIKRGITFSKLNTVKSELNDLFLTPQGYLGPLGSHKGCQKRNLLCKKFKNHFSCFGFFRIPRLT